MKKILSPNILLKYILPILIIIILVEVAIIWINQKSWNQGPGNYGYEKALTNEQIEQIMSRAGGTTTVISDIKLKKLMATPSNTKPNVLSEDEINKIMNRSLN